MANITIHIFTRGIHRGGLTPALAPRMPVITEDLWYVLYVNRGCKCDSTAKGYIKNKSYLNDEEKETLQSDVMNHSSKFWHSAHDHEQQQQAATTAAKAVWQHTEQQQKYMAGIYVQIHTRTSYSSIQYHYNIIGPGTQYSVAKPHTVSIITERDEIKRYTKKKKKKEHTPGIEPSTSYSHGVQGTPVLFHDTCQIDMHLCVLKTSRDILMKKRKQHPSQGDDASTAEAAPGRVGRDEQGYLRRANTTPNGGLHLELVWGYARCDTSIPP